MGLGETNEQLGKGEGAAQRRLETHPTITLARADESTMNVPGEANFPELPTRCELPRTPERRSSQNAYSTHSGE